MIGKLVQSAVNARTEFPAPPAPSNTVTTNAENVATFSDVKTPKLNGTAIGSLAYRNAAAADPDDTITVPGAVGAAPVAYDQAHSEALRAAVNILITAVTALTAEVHDLKANLRSANIVTP
jgi:hypothetical protein